MILVSIVVPVFNSEKYLETCINSLIHQTYKNIEIILVDDGSTDGSGVCCDQIAFQDKRVKVIHKENGGICSARNAGLLAATGDYLMFCDNDDDYSLNAVEKALYYIEKYNVDFLKYCVDYRSVNEDGNVLVQQIQGYPDTIKYLVKEQLLDNYIKIRDSKALTYIWNGIYRMSLITNNNIRFDEKYKYGGEDFDFNYKCLINSKSIGFYNEPLYIHYKRGDHSTAAKYDRNQIQAIYLNQSIEKSAMQYLSIKKNKNLDIYILSKYFVGLISVFSNTKCNESLKFIANEYRCFYKNSKMNEIKIKVLVNYFLKDGKNKRYLMLLFLKMRLFRLISLYTVIRKGK